MIFLLGNIYVLENFLASYIIFLNILFWGMLKESASEIIILSTAIVRQVSLEVIIFLETPSIPKTSEPFEKLLELLSVVTFDAELKPEIAD